MLECKPTHTQNKVQTQNRTHNQKDNTLRNKHTNIQKYKQTNNQTKKTLFNPMAEHGNKVHCDFQYSLVS